MLYRGAEDVSHGLTGMSLLFPFHIQKTSKRAVHGYPMADVRLGPRTEDVWDGLAGVCTATGTADLRILPLRPESTPRRKYLILTVSLGGKDDTGCQFSYIWMIVLF